MRRALVFALALAAACGGSKPAPAPARKAVPAVAAPAPAAEEAKVVPAEWVYSSAGKRDPFRSFVADSQGDKLYGAGPCSTPLGKFELEQFKLVAVVTGLEDPVAMVEAPNGVGYALKRGACIGKNGGLVDAVRSGEVVVAEWAVRADGTRERTRTIIRLPVEALPSLEE